MAIIKKADMNREFTQVVARYMAQGMEFHLEAMNGHQGEDGKVALTDGKHVYMIYLHHEIEGVDFTRALDVEKLTVEKQDIIQGYGTYWLGKGDAVEEITWYRVSNRREDVYVDSLEEAQKIHELQMARWRNSDSYCKNWEAVKYDLEVAKKVVMAKTGRKRVNVENIVRVEKHLGIANYWKIVTMFAGRQKDIYVKAQEVA